RRAPQPGPPRPAGAATATSARSPHAAQRSPPAAPQRSSTPRSARHPPPTPAPQPQRQPAPPPAPTPDAPAPPPPAQAHRHPPTAPAPTAPDAPPAADPAPRPSTRSPPPGPAVARAGSGGSARTPPPPLPRPAHPRPPVPTTSGPGGARPAGAAAAEPGPPGRRPRRPGPRAPAAPGRRPAGPRPGRIARRRRATGRRRRGGTPPAAGAPPPGRRRGPPTPGRAARAPSRSQAHRPSRVVLEEGRRADVAPHHLDAGVAAVLHDRPLVDAGVGGRRHEPGPQRVAGEHRGVETGALRAALHHERHGPVRQPLVAHPPVTGDRPEDRPLGDLGGLEPRPVRPHRARVGVRAVQQPELVALGLLVPLRPADEQAEALLALGDVLDVEGDELAAP